MLFRSGGDWLLARTATAVLFASPDAAPLVEPFLEHSPVPLDDPQLSFFILESQAQTLATFGIPGFDRQTLADLLAEVERRSAG